MIVTACLAWYDEPIEDLIRCVESLPVLCDRLVAVDGGYELVEGAEPVSPYEQTEAIQDAAERVGLEFQVFRSNDLWNGQVAKRDWMMRMAVDGSDWLIPVDSDYVLHGIREAVRAELVATTADAMVVDFHTTLPEGVTRDNLEADGRAANEWHAGMAGETLKMALIFRALPGFRVERHHWWYSGMKDGKRVALWDCGGLYPPGVERQLFAPFVVEHRCLFRDKERVLRNRRFCELRDAQVQKEGKEA